MDLDKDLNDCSSTPDAAASHFSDLKQTKLLCVEYPGYVDNVHKMIATLGGIEKLSDTYFKNKCRLQMTYRPEDLNAHMACADLVPCTGLLMKVRRRKKKGAPKKQYEYKQEIVGFVRNQYKFQTLMDYQYLTPKPMWDYFNTIHGSELGRQNFPLYCAPPSFGRIDTCGAYNYRPDPASTKHVELPRKGISESFEHNPKETTACGRKRRQTESMAALFSNDEIPLEPSANAVAIIENLKSSDSEAINVVRNLFNERPIWSKLAISCHLVNINLDKLKKILQYFSYYWLSGPWRTMWCRFGFDPRKDPSAKIYQMIDFRVRDSKESKINYSLLVPKRSYKNYVPRNLQTRNMHHACSVLPSAVEGPNLKEVDDLEPYIFRPTKMLPCRNMMYQLTDLHDPNVQKIVHENDGIEPICNEKEGWFPAGTMNSIRVELSKTVMAYFEAENKKNKLSRGGDKNKDLIETDSASAATDFQGLSLPVDDSDLQSFSYLQLLQGDDMTEGEEYILDEYNEYE